MATSSPPSLPPRAATFDDIGLDPRLLRALGKLRLTKPTPVQREALPLALRGKDLLAKAPTGSGKTYAYLLPLLHKTLAMLDGTDSPSYRTAATDAVVLVPTRELCAQVHAVARALLAHAGTAAVRVASLSSSADADALRASGPPDVLIATPAQLLQHLSHRSGGAAADELESLPGLRTLVVDEADLLLSYGYGDDMARIGRSLPKSVHTLLFSATLSPDIERISTLFLHNPATVDCSDELASSSGSLSQFYLRCTHADKLLLMYALLKLNRIPGRSLIFVNTVDRGVRLKLFLEQFGVKSGLLNCELPRDSRWHCIQAFNRGVFDVLVATDDPAMMAAAARSARSEPAADESAAAAAVEPAQAKGKKKRKAGGAATSAAAAPDTSADAEFGVSRGIDFCDVTAVINMDLPQSLAVYRHRVGRTARAGQGGTAISMVDSNVPADAALLAQVQETYEASLHEFSVDMHKLAAFRYRVDDAMRAVTRHAVKEARLKEIKQELLHSKKLSEHFDTNPDDMQALRHDKPLATVRTQPHLAHVPTYLKPDSHNATGSVAAVMSTRKLQTFKKRRGGQDARKRKDPLKSFQSGGPKSRKGRRGRK